MDYSYDIFYCDLFFVLYMMLTVTLTSIYFSGPGLKQLDMCDCMKLAITNDFSKMHLLGKNVIVLICSLRTRTSDDIIEAA